MSVFTDADLQSYLRLNRTPLVGLSEDENWWMIGQLQISKKHATFRSGFGHPILATTHFVLEAFESDGVSGCAIVLLSGGKPPAYFAGWVPASRQADAAHWVDELNRAIRAVGAQAPTKQESVVREIAKVVIESGSENAPDDPFGKETVELDERGNLRYERRRHSAGNTVVGTVDPGRFVQIVDSLRQTAFPAAPQTRFAPGASIVRITTLPSGDHVQVSYFEALRMDGYREVVREVGKLAEALRDAKSDVLAAWKFSPE